jgi:hypothetical protein
MSDPFDDFRLSTVRSVDADRLLELFLVCAVSTVLVIRGYLKLTGYPQLGGSGLHFAHMLWGGFFMVAAIVLMLAFLGPPVKFLAATLGGIGFGTFIDELGKFITSDNNYFFQPTIAIIYVIFAALYLLFQWVGEFHPSPRALLMNAAEKTVDAVLGASGPEEAEQALEMLRASGKRGPVVDALRSLALAVHQGEEAAPSLRARLSATARHALARLAGSPWFERAMIVLFVSYAVAFVLLGIVASLIIGPQRLLASSELSVSVMGELGGAVASSLLVLAGAVSLPVSRLAAYGWFKRALLASIFFVQMFLFYENPQAALVALVMNLVLLAGVNYLLQEEAMEQRAAKHLHPVPPLAQRSATRE